MTSRKYGLPPQYPPLGRRGSNTPASPAMVPSSNSQFTQNRSRSLDGLLDSESSPTIQDLPTAPPIASPISAATECIPSERVKQLETCCPTIKPQELHEVSMEKSAANKSFPTIVTTPEQSDIDGDVSSSTKHGSVNNGSSSNKEQNSENILELSNETACDINKASMLSLNSNSSDSKRKRNFMDKCVNKVRSLIKK